MSVIRKRAFSRGPRTLGRTAQTRGGGWPKIIAEINWVFGDEKTIVMIRDRRYSNRRRM